MYYTASPNTAPAQATAARDMAKSLLKAMWNNFQTPLGIALAETRANYNRFDDPVFIPIGWTGTNAQGSSTADRRRLQAFAGANVLFSVLAGTVLMNGLEPRKVRAAAPPGFVYRCGIHFCLDGNLFYFAGANTYDVFTFGDGSSTQTPQDIETRFMDKVRIDTHFARFQADGVNVLRLWMFSHEAWHGLEPQRDVYSEAQFMLFDYIIESAKAHDVPLMPVFEKLPGSVWRNRHSTELGGRPRQRVVESVMECDDRAWRDDE